MFIKILAIPVIGIILGLFISFVSFGQEKTTTTTTTLEETSQTPAKRTSTHQINKSRSTAKPAAVPQPASSTVMSTTTTTEVKPKIVDRKVYNEETLKKLSNNLCANGFKSYVGTVKTNVCLSKANPPDIAYTCVWKEKGPQAYSSNAQGPCNLDYTEHQGSIIIRKDNFPEPPLPFGTEAQCCFRAAKGPDIQAAQ